MGPFIYSEHYMEISTTIAIATFGLGERFGDSLSLREGTYTIFNSRVDTGTGVPSSSYYPAYITRYYVEDEYDNHNFHISYLRNSNPMDVVVANYTEVYNKLTYKMIGGVIDFRFILTSYEPEDALQRLRNYIGKPPLPPFWALGFHQSRRGYHYYSDLANVIKGYESNDIPLDVIWSDVDYMIDQETFTFDEKRFPPASMSKLLDKYKYVVAIPPHIKVGGAAYTEGKKRGVFLKSA